MASVNKVILIGNLGRDPELRHTSGGNSVCNFAIATTEKWTDKEGQKQERTEWHQIVVWGKQGENCEKYLSKGSPVYVEGSLQTRQWDDKDGNKRYTTEVNARQIQFLSSGNGGGQRNSRSDDRPANDGYQGGGAPPSDDIPF